MKSVIAILTIVILAAFAWALYTGALRTEPQTPTTETPGTPTTPRPVATEKQFQNETLGLSFSYPTSYVLTEREVGNGERRHYAITLTRSSDLPLPEAGEGPPTITFDIYQNDLDNLTLRQWITGDSRSNVKLGDGTLTDTSISGAPAVSYRWSGLYEGKTVAFLHKGNVIAVSGTYLTPQDAIVTDFESVVRSIVLR